MKQTIWLPLDKPLMSVPGSKSCSDVSAGIPDQSEEDGTEYTLLPSLRHFLWEYVIESRIIIISLTSDGGSKGNGRQWSCPCHFSPTVMKVNVILCSDTSIYIVYIPPSTEMTENMASW